MRPIIPNRRALPDDTIGISPAERRGWGLRRDIRRNDDIAIWKQMARNGRRK
ncbi:hypothetical protein JQU17_06120 [Ponticoccus sp. SC2-23]|uniref:hypothetical protein n=1 Tax=Alexandriicola marinus TaxID=2081710 RepID=UPI0013DEBA50|nr:hypothetical protein [Alexandriicola marinus]MBM1219766.1 hypothetical protein [Ponticoccus sp. SC6-9]MBM1223162.1 hypothetical protein [Ponticoccus sp. SC6-15]MBM1232128.1 hypothetical protein [Ponticoccus sp. SC6-45]MBM1237922.1 hypothetical protein [Ponticoccus sp. SC6-49]MBM1241139.1 hypothetical protein [Ponticoccus sp. SC2-64]MBM1245652.1 hypothetical protein [Ponticoccus sp. SC6-42]MBM1250130.1 hypothetical protein [Ponticoccus sp. SC6-33]MBM1255931.1 hypothetical protein [Pontico